MAGGDHPKHVRPDCRMQPSVLSCLRRIEANYHAIALHGLTQLTVKAEPGTVCCSIALKSQAIPIPGISEGNAYPSSIRIGSVVSVSSCGMYSTQRALGTAAHSETCSSIKKCGQTGTLKHSAICATLSHGVIPPIRATSTCTIEQAPCCRYSRK